MEKNKTILVIDSNPAAELVRLTLEKEGYQVAVATSGSEGLQETYRLQPDLVILETLMPKMDGWQVLKRLRELSERMLIIILSARKAEEDIIRGLQMGAAYYMTKPFHAEELVARTQALFRRASSQSKRDSMSTLTVGNLTIDLDRQLVMRDGELVNLSPTEFRLLACLVRNRDKVLTHRFLLEEVWGPQHIDDMPYTKLYVRYLRKKLEEDPSNPQLIITEWGTGYRFCTS